MSNEFLGLEGWDWLELFSLAAIAVGALCDLILRGKKLRCSPDENGLIPVSGFFDKERLESKRRNWETFWEVILIFGLIGEIPAALHGIRASSEMKVFAANIGSTNVQLSLRVEELRKQNDEFESQQLPRVINQTKGIEHLTKFAGVKAFIISANDSADSVRVAEQIAAMLISAKWDLGNIIFTPLPVPSGISVGICSTNALWRGEKFEIAARFWGGNPVPGIDSGLENFPKLVQICEAFASELESQDIAIKRDKDINRKTNLRFNGILIFVGQKPSILESKIALEEKRNKQLGDLFWGAIDSDLEDKYNVEWRRSDNELIKLWTQQALGTAYKTNLPAGHFLSVEPKLP